MATDPDLSNLLVQDYLEKMIINHAKAVYHRTYDIDRVWSVVVGFNPPGLYVARVIAYKSASGHTGYDSVKVSSAMNTPKEALKDLMAALRHDI